MTARVGRVQEDGQAGSQEGEIELSGFQEGDAHLIPVGQQSQFCARRLPPNGTRGGPIIRHGLVLEDRSGQHRGEWRDAHPRLILDSLSCAM